MGKRVRLMAGAAGMAPVLGLAVAPAATAAVHASGKKVSLEAGRVAGATACTGTFSKVTSANGRDLGLSVSRRGNCVLGVVGHLHLSESPGSESGDIMRTRIYDGGAQVFSGRIRFTDSSGSVRASQGVGVIGRTVCVTAFSRLHPAKKLAGPLCARV